MSTENLPAITPAQAINWLKTRAERHAHVANKTGQRHTLAYSNTLREIANLIKELAKK